MALPSDRGSLRSGGENQAKAGVTKLAMAFATLPSLARRSSVALGLGNSSSDTYSHINDDSHLFLSL